MSFMLWWNSDWPKNFSRITACLTFSKGLGQLGSIFCEWVLHWCWWAAACSATSSLNKWCDRVQCVMSWGATSQKTKNKGNVEGSTSSLLSRSREHRTGHALGWDLSKDQGQRGQAGRGGRVEMGNEQKSLQLLWHSSSHCLQLNW